MIINDLILIKKRIHHKDDISIFGCKDNYFSNRYNFKNKKLLSLDICLLSFLLSL